MEKILDKLERIQRLREELMQTNPNTKEYEALMEKIRLLSAEYTALIDAPRKPPGPK